MEESTPSQNVLDSSDEEEVNITQASQDFVIASQDMLSTSEQEEEQQHQQQEQEEEEIEEEMEEEEEEELQSQIASARPNKRARYESPVWKYFRKLETERPIVVNYRSWIKTALPT